MKGVQNKHLHSLTVLRFFAAFMVFGFHFFSFPDEYVYLNRLFQRGSFGVDFFFLLSGFVLGYSYFQKFNNPTHQFSLKKFFISRFARIAPVYYLALALSVPLFFYELSRMSELDKSHAWSTIPLSLTFLQSYSGLEITQNSWNIPSWTLSVELFFYLIFPFLSYRILKSKRINTILIILFGINICFAFLQEMLPGTIEIAGISFKTAWAHLPFYHLPQFLIGNCLASLYLKKINLKKHFAWMGFIFFSTLTFCFMLVPSVGIHQSGHPIIVTCFAGFILFSAFVDQYISKFLPATLILLGEASYSLYILQAPIKLLLQQTWSKVLHMPNVLGFQYAIYLATIAVLFSVMSYKFVELPLKDRFINLFSKN